MKKQLTDESVKATKLPKGKDRMEVYDTLCPGLVLRVSSSAKTWMFYFRHDGKFQKLTLGNALTIKLADARKRVNEMAERVRAGANPRAADEDAPQTFAELADHFFAASHRAKKEADRALFRYHVLPVLGAKRLLALTGPDFSRMKAGIIVHCRKKEAETAARLNRPPRARAGERAADLVIGLCKTILRYGIPLGYVTTDFTFGIKRSKRAIDARTRVLSDEEIVELLRALPAIFADEQRQILMRLILLIGCRKGELLGAQIREFRLTATDKGKPTPEWLQPKERVKNGHEHVVPLCPLAVSLVERAMVLAGADAVYLFPSPETQEPFEPTAVHKVLQRAFAPGSFRVREDGGTFKSQKRGPILTCPRFTVHDLRRTAATGMSKLGIPIAIIGKTLNHRSADQSVTGLIYNQHDFAVEKRHALAIWADHVAALERDSLPAVNTPDNSKPSSQFGPQEAVA